MSWTKIDMAPSVRKETKQTVALTTWRCDRCRALAVTIDDVDPGKCGKCKP